jgi:hypothetical protein
MLETTVVSVRRLNATNARMLGAKVQQQKFMSSHGIAYICTACTGSIVHAVLPAAA